MKRFFAFFVVLLLSISFAACGAIFSSNKEKESEEEIELDVDVIVNALVESGYFPDSLEVMDSGEAVVELSLYEDRIEANPEDLADSRYAMALGMLADRFILIEGVDSEATDRLEKALSTYAEDKKSDFEFYSPMQAVRLDNPIIERQGNYLLFAIGEDEEALAKLCSRLMTGEGQ